MIAARPATDVAENELLKLAAPVEVKKEKRDPRKCAAVAGSFDTGRQGTAFLCKTKPEPRNMARTVGHSQLLVSCCQCSQGLNRTACCQFDRRQSA
jgi:hypothetical protein